VLHPLDDGISRHPFCGRNYLGIDPRAPGSHLRMNDNVSGQAGMRGVQAKHIIESS
jgi:hypothetical protein